MPDIEEYSLTYLKYKKYFTEKPLARCLDGVTADLSQMPLDEIFENASKNTEHAIVTVDMSGYNNGGESSSVASARAAAAAPGGSAQGHAAEKAPAGLAGSAARFHPQQPQAVAARRPRQLPAATRAQPRRRTPASSSETRARPKSSGTTWGSTCTSRTSSTRTRSRTTGPRRGLCRPATRAPPAPGRTPRGPAASRQRARRQLAFHEPIAELDEDEAALPVQPSMVTYECEANSAQRGGR